MKNFLFPRMHVSLYVSDMAKTIDFYNTFFGKQPDKIRTSYSKYILDEPSLIISFVENTERVQQNFGHLGFQVATIDDLNNRQQLAQEAGLLIREETGTNCCFAKQDKFWVTDPDGIQWEVYYFHEDAEFNDPHYEQEIAPACCIAQVGPTPGIEINNLAVMESCCTPGAGCC